ncbi:putative nucleic acid-binding protein, contains PIN domain [Candidatus Fervidibacteria bacterium JGI MDM2 JNZ-1-D12]
MAKVVVNASVSVKWFNTSEPYSQQASAMLRDFLDGHIEMHVPELWFYEMAQAISKAINRGLLTESEGASAVTLISRLGLIVHLNPSWQLAFAFARQNRIQVYDAVYVLLAGELGCDLWTADERLVRSIGGAYPFVRFIADYGLRS